MRKIDYTEEGQYHHPGPVHLQFGRYVNEPGDFTSMNTDGHLRPSSSAARDDYRH